MKKLLLLSLLITLSSCFLFQDKGIVFKIENTSDYPVTNIKISTSEHLDSITFDEIAPKDYREDFLSMKNNKSDGHYTLSFTREDGTTVNENHGYYTHGGSLENWIHFEIQNDTTVVRYGDFKTY
ncbi:hypothetical protein EJ994_03250 [Maribacter sp. MJ134]|uniref:hypothetical protein n=1 Tax=Maribacter sp. MJ134 TaxID=2496865 RepID=UPI000F84BF2C|nr:hypothetical protein [Maribacter sp. MJ134]AZQ57867.1 hypothetical protein EJ994_03250 [Maribacter sp. MJ134]